MRFQPPVTTHSSEPCATSTKEFTQLPPLAAKPTIQAVVARYTYMTPPAPTSQPLGQTSSGIDPGAKIGIESGITLGICVVILVVGLLIYRFRRRKSNRDADINQASTSIPSDLYPPPSELLTQYQTSGRRDKMPANSTAPAPSMVADDQILPVTPQQVFVIGKGSKSRS
jgi:hypothetical protein